MMVKDFTYGEVFFYAVLGVGRYTLLHRNLAGGKEVDMIGL